ncbi:hypothetical protein VTO42DRAFT_4154 [Malbranchea cinnamomea]
MVAITDENGYQEASEQTFPPALPPASVFHHSLVTSDSDALKFRAAASLQLPAGIPRLLHHHHHYNGGKPAAPTDTRLIISPYNDDRHLLDLTTLDTPNYLLAKALTALKPVRNDYATAQYTESFNWPLVLAVLRDLAAAEGYRWRKRSFYVVTFRSTLLPTTDSSYLHELDAHSLAEAIRSGGLLKYWFGTKDDKCRNLATCVWRSREDARRGGTGPWHRKARAAASQLYRSIEFTTLEWTIGDAAEEWEFKPWDDSRS